MSPFDPNALEQAIVSDLREACAPLLDRGLASIAPSDRLDRPLGPLGITLEYADLVVRLVPKAIDDCVHIGNDGRERIVAVATPMRARLPRRANDYARAGTTAVPLRWERSEPVGTPPRAALGWLLHVVERAIDRALSSRVGLSSALGEALVFRDAASRYGRQDADRLGLIESELAGAIMRLTKLATHLHSLTGLGLTASVRYPVAAATSSSWRTLRRLDASFDDPGSMAGAVALSLIRSHRGSADVPYLYQRWCGWRLHEAIVSLGFEAQVDPLPPLLLAGAIEYVRDDVTWTLLSEPRLASRKDSLSGLTVNEGEATPDLVLMVRGDDGLIEAHIIDPTLSTSADVRRQKRKYLHMVKLTETRTVSGVRVVPGPTRSWAAAPLKGTKCMLEFGDWRGLHGTIPMNPVDYQVGALLDWLGELTDRV